MTPQPTKKQQSTALAPAHHRERFSPAYLTAQQHMKWPPHLGLYTLWATLPVCLGITGLWSSQPIFLTR